MRGLFGTLAGERKAAASSLDLFREIYGSPAVKSGQAVNWKTALEVTTVLACVGVRARGNAQVPLKLFRERADGGRDPAKDHPLYDVLHRRPNPWQTSFEFRTTMEFHRTLCGNAFAFINRVRGKVVELLPLEPGSVTVEQQADWSIRYEVTGKDGRKQVVPAEAIWHLRGPSWNSWMGLETVRQAREAIGLAMATEEAHARLHKNGVQTSGLYSVEGTMTTDQYKQLRAWIEENHASSANSGKPFVLDRSAKWTAQAMTGVDAQHIETRRLQIEEICRALNVFPQMIGHSDKTATYASAEQFFIAHVIHTLGPEYEAWEQSIDVNLLSDEDRAAGLYAKFMVNGLLRGAMKDRAEFYTKLYGIGAINPNEIRALEEMNPYEGGENFRVPLNMTDPNDAPPDDPAQSENGA